MINKKSFPVLLWMNLTAHNPVLHFKNLSFFSQPSRVAPPVLSLWFYISFVVTSHSSLFIVLFSFHFHPLCACLSLSLMRHTLLLLLLLLLSATSAQSSLITLHTGDTRAYECERETTYLMYEGEKTEDRIH